jgi:hypothetical protein
MKPEHGLGVVIGREKLCGSVPKLEVIERE